MTEERILLVYRKVTAKWDPEGQAGLRSPSIIGSMQGPLVRQYLKRTMIRLHGRQGGMTNRTGCLTDAT
jgi:hypothetical protein